MPDVYNPIYIGEEWSQDLELTAGVIQPGDTLLAHFRPSVGGPKLFECSSGNGLSMSGLILNITISAAKTSGIVLGSASHAYVFTDVARIDTAGVRENLGFRLRIPCVQPVTR